MLSTVTRTALALAFALATAAGCGIDDDILDTGRGVANDVGEDTAASFAISAVDVEVTECPCRCATDTNTRLTVRGVGFADGDRVLVDGVAVNGAAIDANAIDVSLWASPAAGVHAIDVVGVDDAGDERCATATFTMPD